MTLIGNLPAGRQVSDKAQAATPERAEYRTVKIQAADVVEVVILVNGKEAGRLGPFAAKPTQSEDGLCQTSRAQVRLRVAND